MCTMLKRLSCKAGISLETNNHKFETRNQQISQHGGLSLRPSKSEAVILSRRNPPAPLPLIYIGSLTIQRVVKSCLLGLTVPDLATTGAQSQKVIW